MADELKRKVEGVWDAFWSSGVSNPLDVIEQITYLLFVKHLDEIQTRKDNEAERTGKPDPDPFFAEDQQELRWQNFRARDPGVMYDIVQEGVFPYLRAMGGDGSTYSRHMRDAWFFIPTAALLARVVDLVDAISREPSDIRGDIYESLLTKIATVGQNGQYRTPRHIVDLMVEMTRPQPDDEVCDPACGTAGFLVRTASYVRGEHALLDVEQQAHFNASMFHGFDFDSTMLRIASMNMLLHGVENPDIRYRDSLAESAADEPGRYSLILANPPFAGGLDHEHVAADLLRVVNTKKTELLFLALCLRLLKPGGRAAVIVPDGVLFGSTKAHRELRRTLVEDQKLDGVVKLPSGVFKPYAGASAAILLFTRTNSGGTDDVWFYDVRADGFSLDDKRTPLLPEDRLGVRPEAGPLTEKEHRENNIPDVLSRWFDPGAERGRARTEQSFCVPKSEIVAQQYDLSLNRYAERPRYLTVGSRVTLADLLGAGFLKEGMQLAFERAGVTYVARVTAAGQLELAGGQKFPSPNRAAAVALGEGPVDGWQAWALQDGTTLDRVRRQFLDTPAVGIPGPGDTESADRVPGSSPESDVESPLPAEQGKPATPPAEAAETPRRIRSVDEPGRDEDEDAPVVGRLTVGDLPSAFGGVTYVSRSATFDEAITRMVVNDYSQLPILSGRKLGGAVTWQSIARARHANHNPPFSRAIVRASEVPYDRDLIDVLPMLAEHEFVFVRNQRNEIGGIVTASDLAARYGAMATPFFLVGELDRRLRQVLASSIEFTQVQNLCDPEGNRSIEGFDDLSMGDYQRVLENKEAWERVGWSLDRKIFIERLDEIRQIRNDLMHFNPEPLPVNSIRQIRHMINVLREYGN